MLADDAHQSHKFQKGGRVTTADSGMAVLSATAAFTKMQINLIESCVLRCGKHTLLGLKPKPAKEVGIVAL